MLKSAALWDFLFLVEPKTRSGKVPLVHRGGVLQPYGCKTQLHCKLLKVCGLAAVFCINCKRSAARFVGGPFLLDSSMSSLHAVMVSKNKKQNHQIKIEQDVITTKMRQ